MMKRPVLSVALILCVIGDFIPGFGSHRVMAVIPKQDTSVTQRRTGIQRVEYVQSQKGGRQVLIDNFKYRINRKGSTATYWKCLDAVRGCKARCTTVGDLLRDMSAVHNHPPENDTVVRVIDNMRESHRILCLKSHLQEASVLYIDGTSYACPLLWSQLYVIHTLIGQKMTPLVFWLMPDRKKETYLRLFEHLMSLVVEITGAELDPETIQIDFESAVIEALRIKFPMTHIRGCYFHFSQAIWRKVQDLGLVRLYKQNADVKQWVGRAAALPLLPPADVQDVWFD